MFYWVSLTEILTFCFAILCWLKIIDQMGAVILFFPHLFRGITGLMINKKFPRSHHIVEDVEWLGENAAKNQLSFENVKSQLTYNFSKIYIEAYTENKKYLNLYLAFTWMSWFLNFGVFFVLMKNYGTPGEEDAEMILLLILIVYVICSLQWLSFAIQIKYRLPEHIGKMFFDAAMSFGDDHL
jgi:hypothetical protein